MLLQKAVVVLRNLPRIGERAATPAPLHRGAATERLDQPIFLDREVEKVRFGDPPGIGAQLVRHRKIDIAGLLPAFVNVFWCLIVIDVVPRPKHEGTDFVAIEIDEATSGSDDDEYLRPVGQHRHLSASRSLAETKDTATPQWRTFLRHIAAPFQ